MFINILLGIINVVWVFILRGDGCNIEVLYVIFLRNQDGFITKKEMAQVAKRLTLNQVGLESGVCYLPGPNIGPPTVLHWLELIGRSISLLCTLLY